MKFKSLHPNFSLPTRGTDHAGAFDLYMPEGGYVPPVWERGDPLKPVKVKLGFAAEVPPGHVALLLPRSSAGTKHSVELENTCGVIDSDYRGEWMACLSTKNGEEFIWEAGDRVLQMLIVPVVTPDLQLVEELSESSRGSGGFGSTGK